MARLFGIDLRTLALFRICLGALILADLINRASDLTAFYTDQGTLTRAAAIAFNHPVRISFHLMSGSPLVIGLLFVVAGILAVLLMLGYRTRLVTVLSWLFLISLNNRNLLVQQAGDQLISVLAFWAMFLPIGARYSVDAALRPDDQPRPGNAYFSAATFAMLLQVIYVYVIGALLKDSPVWVPDGQAVYYALHLDSLATPLAHWFRQYGAILQLLTYYVWTLELIAPLLVFSPIWHLPVRLVTMVLLITMHLGFYLFLEIGLFPFISIASLLLFTPSEVWDWLGRWVYPPEKRAISIYYDGACGFCLKTAKLFRELCLPQDVPIRPAQDDPAIRPIFEAEDSWVVTDTQGNQRTKWAAFAFVLRQSPVFWLFGKAFEWRPLARLGDRLYRLIGNHRAGALGRLSTQFLPYRRQWLRLSRPEALLVGALTVLVFAHNLTTLSKVDYKLPEAVEGFQKAIRLSQTWNMFAPRPLLTDGWFVIRGVMEDDAVVDLWHRLPGEPDTAKPRYVSQWYRDYRWRKYLSRLPKTTSKEQLHNLGRYYCRTYNRFNPGPVRLATLTIDYYRERTLPDYQPPQSEVIRLLNWYCYDKAAE
jgi:predicted DCC family thiol-disulfide oxidoreductase YuxK